MHEKRGNFCIFLLKIAEKEGKTDLRPPDLFVLLPAVALIYRDLDIHHLQPEQRTNLTFIIQHPLINSNPSRDEEACENNNVKWG